MITIEIKLAGCGSTVNVLAELPEDISVFSAPIVTRLTARILDQLNCAFQERDQERKSKK